MLQNLEFVLGPSRFLFLLFLFLYFGAGIIILLSDFYWILKLLILAFLFFDFKKLFNQVIMRKSFEATVGLYKDSKNRWWIKDKRGRVNRGILLGESYLTSLISILRIRTKARVLTVLVPYDAMSAKEYHALRLAMRYSKSK